MRRIASLPLLLAALSLSPLVLVAHSAPEPSHSETLLSTSTAWNGDTYTAYPSGAPQLSVLRITVAPHGQLPWHLHPVPNAAYIVSGQITVEQQNRPSKLFTAGQVIPETVNVVHRGTAGDEPAVLVVFYAGAQGIPLATRMPAAN